MTIVLGAHDIKTLEKGKPQTFKVDSKKTMAVSIYSHYPPPPPICPIFFFL